MEGYELNSFSHDLNALKKFLYLLEPMNRNAVHRWIDDIEETKLDKILEDLRSLEGKILSASRLAKIIEPSIGEMLDKVINKAEFLTGCNSLIVELELMKNHQASVAENLSIALSSVAMRLFGFGAIFDNSFSDRGEAPAIRSMLSDLERISTSISSLEAMFYRRDFSSDEVFKPKNIDITAIRQLIGNAKSSIFEAHFSDENLKKNLLEYISEAEIELESNTPAWRKIIGALVVISTVLGGIATAPEALENINAAMQAIIGPAVEENIPSKSDTPSLLPNTTLL